MIRVIKFIGFANEQGVPSERWSRYRGSQQRRVLAEGIVEGYSELYATYPDAHNRTNAELVSSCISKRNAVSLMCRYDTVKEETWPMLRH